MRVSGDAVANHERFRCGMEKVAPHHTQEVVSQLSFGLQTYVICSSRTTANTAISRDMGGKECVLVGACFYSHGPFFPSSFLILSICLSVCLPPHVSVGFIVCLKASREEGVDEEKIEKDAKVRHLKAQQKNKQTNKQFKTGSLLVFMQKRSVLLAADAGVVFTLLSNSVFPLFSV